MDDRVKSALEIAMEKVAKLGQLTPEEGRELKWVPEGEKTAALYLRGEAELSKALGSLDAAAVLHVIKGLLTVLLASFGLPRNEAAAATNRKVLEALRFLCKDPKALELLLGRMSHVLDQYASYGRQQMERAYGELKQQFAALVQQKLQQQGVRSGSVRVDIDSMPEFQNQWRATVAQLERQYEQHLVQYREQLRQLVLSKPRLP